MLIEVARGNDTHECLDCFCFFCVCVCICSVCYSCSALVMAQSEVLLSEHGACFMARQQKTAL